MAIEITVPALGESVTEATVGQWFKKPGDAVNVDEPLVELETDKVTVEVPAPAAGVLADIKVPQGTTVAVGSVLGSIKRRRRRRRRGRDSQARAACAKPSASARQATRPPASRLRRRKPASAAASARAPAEPSDATAACRRAPAARKMMEEKGLAADDVQGSGRRGQVLKEDVLARRGQAGRTCSRAGRGRSRRPGADDDRAGARARRCVRPRCRTMRRARSA